jgi:hypothetical protein
MKRPCPWEVDQQPMMKMHHSEKDQVVKTGALESVYTKTLALLFSGANKKASQKVNLAHYCSLRPGSKDV